MSQIQLSLVNSDDSETKLLVCMLKSSDFSTFSQRGCCNVWQAQENCIRGFWEECLHGRINPLGGRNSCFGPFCHAYTPPTAFCSSVLLPYLWIKLTAKYVVIWSKKTLRVCELRNWNNKVIEVEKIVGTQRPFSSSEAHWSFFTQQQSSK